VQHEVIICVSNPLQSLFFNTNENAWIYDFPIGEVSATVSVMPFLSFYVNGNHRGLSDRKYCPIFIPLSKHFLHFCIIDFMVSDFNSNIFHFGLLQGKRNNISITSIINKKMTKRDSLYLNTRVIDISQKLKIPEVLFSLRSISNFVSEESMLSFKNFIILLLSPLTLDIKKHEQIESCIRYPYCGTNKSLIQGILPNGLQLQATIIKTEKKKIEISLSNTDSFCILSILQKLSNIFQLIISELPETSEFPCNFNGIDDSIFERVRKVICILDDFEIKTKLNQRTIRPLWKSENYLLYQFNEIMELYIFVLEYLVKYCF